MSCSNQIICYTSPHLSLHVPFFFLLIILTHCYVIVYSFYYPPLQAYLQYKKSLSNIIHLSHRQIRIYLTVSKMEFKYFIQYSTKMRIDHFQINTHYRFLNKHRHKSKDFHISSYELIEYVFSKLSHNSFEICLSKNL